MSLSGGGIEILTHSTNRRTMEMVGIANTIMGMIEMEEDHCMNHEDRKVPILDLKVWVDNSKERGEIKYDFYEKSMASKTVMHSRSVLTAAMKKSILVAEMGRRLRNCYMEMEWEKKASYVIEYCRRMYVAGHNEQFRNEVVKRALTNFFMSSKRDRDGVWPMYRSKNEREQQWSKMGGRPRADNWYKKIGFSTSIQMPATIGEGLVKRMRKNWERQRHQKT